MTMAYGEGHSGDLVRLCNVRLSDGDRASARAEFDMLVAGAHPLLDGIPAPQRAEVLAGVRRFASAVGTDFDCLNGSIGNFVLAGFMLGHDGDSDAAIADFRRLTGLRDLVLPAARDHDLHLTALLRDGLVISGQHRITGLDAVVARAGIGAVQFSDGRMPQAHPRVIEAIAEADLIAFGPGSFFTSILPHLLVGGVVGAVAANRRAAKVFIANLVECNETRGRTVADLVKVFAAAGEGLVDTVLVDRQPFPAGKTTNGNVYLDPGDLSEIAIAYGLTVRTGNLEDVWNRGRHDGPAVAAELRALAAR
jgi:uncharacterized cofD-like protein